MPDINARIDLLTKRAGAAKAVVAQKQALFDKAEVALDKANEALYNANWELDDLIIQSWDDYPDVGALLNVDSGGRMYHELRAILKTKFGDTLWPSAQWCHAPQRTLSIYLDASEPGDVEKAEAAINFFSPHVNKLHPEAIGCSVFNVNCNTPEEASYEFWHATETDHVVLAKYVHNKVVDKTQFGSVRECLVFIHSHLSCNLSG